MSCQDEHRQYASFPRPRNLCRSTSAKSDPPWRTLLSLPAIAEKEERIPIGPGRCHVRRVGDLLHPQQQSRGSRGGFMIKRDQIQYCFKVGILAKNPVYRIHDRHVWISPSRKRPAAYRCQSVRTSMLLGFFAALANRWSKLTIASHPSALAK
jgi:hypothetical protein